MKAPLKGRLLKYSTDPSWIPARPSSKGLYKTLIKIFTQGPVQESPKIIKEAPSGESRKIFLAVT
jgi:hypothetical protein